jgi:hypothetical protein
MNPPGNSVRLVRREWSQAGLRALHSRNAQRTHRLPNKGDTISNLAPAVAKQLICWGFHWRSVHLNHVGVYVKNPTRMR